MVQAISACPMTIDQLLDLAEKIENGEAKIDDVVDGLIDPDALAIDEAEEDSSADDVVSSKERGMMAPITRTRTRDGRGR